MGTTGALGDLHAQFEDHDGYSAKSKAEQLMVGLGFSEEEFENPLKDFLWGLESTTQFSKNIDATF